MTRTIVGLAALWIAAGAPKRSEAAEVQFDGYYRARFRAYDTLSLNRDLADSEGLAAYTQHRFLLQPRILVNDQVALYAELR